LSRHHIQTGLLKYVVTKNVVKKAELRLTILQVDINTQQIQAKGLGLDSLSHDWGNNIPITSTTILRSAVTFLYDKK
jgi:hypothetical protein